MPWNVPSFFRRLRVFAAIVVVAAFFSYGRVGLPQTSPAPELLPFPGGLIETATTGLIRPRLSVSVLQALLPSRGPFVFPLPYGTQGVRITNASDCGGGDCVDAVGYSYWRNINNHVASDEMLILVGLNRARGGQGPSVFRYNKTTDQVTNLGPLFPASSAKSFHSAEGWYFSGTQPTKIYIDDGPRMLRYDVLTKQTTTVFDVAPGYGADKVIWQMHSSDDDRVHSVTLRSTPSFEMLGCLVYHEDTAQFQYFPKIGDFNECHVDKSGRYLMSLEDVDGLYDLEMRIFDLQTGTERLVMDQAGAVGHADMGHGYMIGDDTWNSRANAMMVWDFTKDPLSGRLVSYNLDWSAPAPNHTSHGNARPGVPASDQYACGSSATRVDAIWGNEIICFRMDGSLNVLVVAPVMTDLNAPGGGSDDYVKRPKGNLDVTGQYFIWTSNAGGNRLDAFLVKVPGQLLVGGGAGDTAAPTAILTAPLAGSTVSGTFTVTATAADDVGVLGVQFKLDGANLGMEDTSAPYSISWNTTGAPDGLHSLTAVARDAAGHAGTSVPASVTVTNVTSGTGPVGSWPLSEGSGASAADASGNGFNGLLAGAPAWIAGRVGPGLSLDGADDYVAVPHAVALNPYPLTIAAWLKTTSTGLHGVVNKYFPGSFNGYQVFMNGGYLCAWYFRDATDYVWDGTSCSLSTPGYNDGLWHHVALVVDAAGGRLYVDGVQKSARAWTGTAGATTTTVELALGRYPAIATPYLPGAIDEVRVYGRALGATEIAGLASADTIPPLLSAIKASILSATEASITWITDEPADTQVEYGTTAAYGSSAPPDGTRVTSHSQVLKSLAPGTLYHFRVKSRDASGNLAVSSDATFTTPVVSPGGGKHKGRPG